MIANAYLNEWRQTVPWSDNKMIEQDLIISRLLVELLITPRFLILSPFAAVQQFINYSPLTLCVTLKILISCNV